MLFRAVAKCSAHGTNAMRCTSKHRLCDTTKAKTCQGLPLKPLICSSPFHTEGDIFMR